MPVDLRESIDAAQGDIRLEEYRGHIHSEMEKDTSHKQVAPASQVHPGHHNGLGNLSNNEQRVKSQPNCKLA